MRRPIQIRRGTAAEWAAANPILRPGELGLETDTGRIKAAPGRAGVAWNSIRGYVNRSESRNRYAAKSLGGSSSTDGAFCAYTASGITGATTDITVSMLVAYKVAPAASMRLWGSNDASFPAVILQSEGYIQGTVTGVGNMSTSSTPLLLADGLTHEVRIRVTNPGSVCTIAVSIDGVSVYTGTVAGSLGSGAGTFYVGSQSATGTQRFPGSIWNLTHTDNVTAANSRTFLMDEPPTSTSFADSSGNGGAAATKGTGRAFPWVTSVASTDGRGMPFQGVGSLGYATWRDGDTTGITGATTYVPATTSGEIDPTGSLSLGVFTLPAAGDVVATFSGSIVPTTLAGADNIQVLLTPSTGNPAIQVLSLTAANVYAQFSITRRFSLAAGATVTCSFASLVAGDVFTLGAGWGYAITFTPTAQTG